MNENDGNIFFSDEWMGADWWVQLETKVVLKMYYSNKNVTFVSIFLDHAIQDEDYEDDNPPKPESGSADDEEDEKISERFSANLKKKLMTKIK